MTCAEALLVAEGYHARIEKTERIFRRLAVIAGCGPYTEEGIESLLSDGKTKAKPRRSKDEEAALVLKKYRKDKNGRTD